MICSFQPKSVKLTVRSWHSRLWRLLHQKVYSFFWPTQQGCSNLCQGCPAAQGLFLLFQATRLTVVLKTLVSGKDGGQQKVLHILQLTRDILLTNQLPDGGVQRHSGRK